MRATAIVFPEKNRCVLEELTLPDPGPKDLVVETEVCGVSVGTERWALVGLRPEISYPNVPGYQGVGKVIEVGSEAARHGYSKGSRVHFLRCRLPVPYGTNSWMGSHVSRAVVDVVTGLDADPDHARSAVCETLPEGLDPLDASLAGLAGVSLQGIEMAVIPAGACVLVTGLGVLGQYAAQVCRLKGTRVAVSDPVDLRLDIARRLGADWTINPAKESLEARTRDIAPVGFDVIIDTSSISAVLPGLLPLVKERGKFIFQGYYPPPSVFDLSKVAGQMPTWYFPNGHTGLHIAAAMRWMADGFLKTKPLLTHVVKVEQAPEIYRMIAAGSQDFLGVAFDWRRP
ncbi:MAG: zinc-binding alcohol dehydrogenase [Planctomycetota bacterium]